MLKLITLVTRSIIPLLYLITAGIGLWIIKTAVYQLTTTNVGIVEGIALIVFIAVFVAVVVFSIRLAMKEAVKSAENVRSGKPLFTMPTLQPTPKTPPTTSYVPIQLNVVIMLE